MTKPARSSGGRGAAPGGALIVQDAISGEDTERAVRAAGLTDLLHTPDADPAGPWPTLGEIIDSGRRLVVFAKKADGPAPRYRTSTGTGWRRCSPPGAPRR